jgi:hypothetical protein
MLKSETSQTERIKREAQRDSATKARIASVGAALAVVSLLSGCATGPDGERTGLTGWWRAQAARQDAAARAAVSPD